MKCVHDVFISTSAKACMQSWIVGKKKNWIVGYFIPILYGFWRSIPDKQLSIEGDTKPSW